MTAHFFSFRGKTSYPYLSGYTWVSFCNWKMLNTDYGSGPARFNAEEVKCGDTIFVESQSFFDRDGLVSQPREPGPCPFAASL